MARKHNRTGRSRTASFAMLPHFLLSSPAWRSLSLPGRATYIELIALYVPGRNGRLAMSARTLAEKLPISRATAARALKELSGRGFLELTKPGGFNVKSGAKRASEWRLSLYRCDVTGEPASRAFMRWRGVEIHSTASLGGHDGLAAEPEVIRSGDTS